MRTRKYRFLLFKIQFLNTSADPADPPEMEHEVRLPTHQQRAKGQDDGSLNKLLQITLRQSSSCMREGARPKSGGLGATQEH